MNGDAEIIDLPDTFSEYGEGADSLHTKAVANAGLVLAQGILLALVRKGIFTRDEARDVIIRAIATVDDTSAEVASFSIEASDGMKASRMHLEGLLKHSALEERRDQ